MPARLQETYLIDLLYVTSSPDSQAKAFEIQSILIDDSSISVLCLESMFVWGDDYERVIAILKKIAESKVALFINAIAINIRLIFFQRRIIDIYGIGFDDTKFLLSPQHIGRISRINNQNSMGRNIWGYRYTKTGNSFVMVRKKPEWLVVKELFHFYSQDDSSLRATSEHIRKYIQAKHFFELGNRMYHPIQVLNILKRPEYCGHTYNWDHSDSSKSNHIPNPIISYDTWKSAQSKISRRSRRLKESYWISGRLTCAECGQAYYLHKARKQVFHSNKGSCDYCSKTYPLERIEDIITIVALMHSDFNYFSILETIFDTLLEAAKGSKASNTRSNLFEGILEDSKKSPQRNISEEVIRKVLEKANKENKTFLFIFNIVFKSLIGGISGNKLPNIVRLAISFTADQNEKTKRASHCMRLFGRMSIKNSYLRISTIDGGKELICLSSLSKVWRKRLRVLNLCKVYFKKPPVAT